MELELLAVADDRVAGVVAALKAHDHVGLLGEQVGDLSLSLVAPLGADDHDSWHGAGIMERSAGAARAGVGHDAVAQVLAVAAAAILAHLDQARDDPRADLLLELVVVEVRGHDASSARPRSAR